MLQGITGDFRMEKRFNCKHKIEMGFFSVKNDNVSMIFSLSTNSIVFSFTGMCIVIRNRPNVTETIT